MVSVEAEVHRVWLAPRGTSALKALQGRKERGDFPAHLEFRVFRE